MQKNTDIQAPMTVVVDILVFAVPQLVSLILAMYLI